GAHRVTNGFSDRLGSKGTHDINIRADLTSCQREQGVTVKKRVRWSHCPGKTIMRHLSNLVGVLFGQPRIGGYHADDGVLQLRRRRWHHAYGVQSADELVTIRRLAQSGKDFPLLVDNVTKSIN